MNSLSNVKKNLSHHFVLIATSLYALLVIFFSSFHEVWRDETVPLTIVRENSSLPVLWEKLRNFGHPAAWDTLLYLAYQIFPHPSILKILNLTICILAVYLFLSKSPFSRLQKILFIGGLFPLYIYPVINRNYGLIMLLVFAVCALYKDRWRKIIPFSLVLVLLANTHAHALIVTIAVVISMMSEIVFLKPVRDFAVKKKTEILIGFLIVTAGIMISLFMAVPDSSSIIFSQETLTPVNVVKAFIKSLIIPGKYFPWVLGFKSALFVNLVIFGMALYLLRKINLFVFFVSGVIGLAMFFELCYPTVHMRHQGAVYLLMIMVLWMDYYVVSDGIIRLKKFKPLETYFTENKENFLTFLLVIQVCMAYPAIRNDLTNPYSATRNFASLIQSVPALKDAILIQAPEATALESVTYYIDNPIYLSTEKIFAKYRRFTSIAGVMNIDLQEFLTTAQNLKKQYGKLVIILLDEKIRPDGPREFDFSYTKKFRYSDEQLAEVYRQTVFLGDFTQAMSDERFRVYLLK